MPLESTQRKEGRSIVMIRRGKPPIGYMTASQAKRELGNISDGMLRSLVLGGKIEKYTPKGRKQGFYRISHVRNLALEMDDLLPQQGQPRSQFLQANEHDIHDIVHLLIEIFGGGDTSARRLSWIHKNPETIFVMKNKGKIVGVVFVLPFTREKVFSLLHDPDTASTSKIADTDILPYEPGTPVNLFFMSLGAREGVTSMGRRIWGGLLMIGLQHFIIDLGKRGILIETLAARAGSADGARILKGMGFTEIISPSLRNFIIDVPPSGIPVILKYKQAYQEYHDDKEPGAAFLDFTQS